MEGLILGAIVLLNYVTIAVHGEPAEGCSTTMPYTSLVTRRQDTCYQFISEETSWRGARSFCYRYSGRLVNIDDAATNTFIEDTLDGMPWGNSGVWIGLHDRSDELSWKWDAGDREDDLPMKWSNWARGHPAAFLHSMRDCVRMVRQSHWKWHETPCNLLKWKYRFICQYDAEETTTPSLNVHGWHNGLQHGRPEDGDHRVSSDHSQADTTPLRTTWDDSNMWYNQKTGPPISAERVGQEPENASSSSAGWLVAMGLVIFLLIIALIVVVFIRRRRSQKNQADTTRVYVEPPIYKQEKGGWLHEGRANKLNDYVLDWSPAAVTPSPEHTYEECKVVRANACTIYANDDAKGKVSASSENDNVENEDNEKQGLLGKPRFASKPTDLYIPMNGSVSSLESAGSSSSGSINKRPLPRSPATDDGYQVPKPMDPEYHMPRPSDGDGYQVPKSLPMEDVHVPMSEDQQSDCETDQHIYESIDEIKQRK